MLSRPKFYQEESHSNMSKADNFTNDESQRYSISTNITASTMEFERDSYGIEKFSEFNQQKDIQIQPSLPVQTSEQNILNGFMEMVNRASSFWMRKFNRMPEPLVSYPETEKPLNDVRTNGNNNFESHSMTVSDFQENIDYEPNERETIMTEDQELETDSLSSRRNYSTKGNLNWRSEHDSQLLNLFKNPKTDWNNVFIHFKDLNVSQKFLMKRYQNLQESANNKRSRFTHDEDLEIVKYHGKYGSNWNAIASHLPNRTAAMVKNRFYSYIKKKNKHNSLVAEVNAQNQFMQEEALQNHDIINYNKVQPLADVNKPIVNPLLERMGSSTLIESNSLQDECLSLTYEEISNSCNYFNNESEAANLQEESLKLSNDCDIFNFKNPFSAIAQREKLNAISCVLTGDDNNTNKYFGEHGNYIQYNQNHHNNFDDWNLLNTGAKKMKIESKINNYNEPVNKSFNDDNRHFFDNVDAKMANIFF